MITLYLRDAMGVFTRSVEINPMDRLPPLAVLKAPPLIAVTEVARWNGADWDVLDEYPQPTAQEIAAIKQATADARWGAIKAERDGARAQGGVLLGANWFHTDTDSRIKWLGLKDTARDMLAASVPPSETISVDGEAVLWKTMAGDFVPVTIQVALDVVDAVKVLDKQLFKQAELHYAAMLASTDPASYDYSTGWPDRFVDFT